MCHAVLVKEIRIVRTVLAGNFLLRGVSVSERCYSFGSESKRSQGHALNSSSLVRVIVTFFFFCEHEEKLRWEVFN